MLAGRRPALPEPAVFARGDSPPDPRMRRSVMLAGRRPALPEPAVFARGDGPPDPRMRR
jgi:hypothetical protein